MAEQLDPHKPLCVVAGKDRCVIVVNALRPPRLSWVLVRPALAVLAPDSDRQWDLTRQKLTGPELSPRGGGAPPRPAPAGASRTQASASGWVEAISAEFPPLGFPDLKKAEGGKKAEGDQVAEDLLKFPESAVDGTVEQRQEELLAYRKQAERNQRLASEGIDGARGILAN
ncbi:unnamed protein product [Prorocentrum cordatum]|uniref:Uncharacterized protein n=1 Tax=Prorocentrum cordatum TaxID=2364126 RepID=A0ABN9S9S5_9DINO|nr:unnamed protein product [Polarella glacialis]